MATKSREVPDIDEQALLNFIAEKSNETSSVAPTAPIEQTVITVPDETTVQKSISKLLFFHKKTVTLERKVL